ncbi:MAG: phosphate-starvation-inducible PsiE family protein [Butyricicoccaceae bacterium]
MKNQFRERLSFCATMIEMVVGGLILIGCIISGIGLIGTTSIAELLGDAHYLQDRMSDACLILIGAEMLKMITSYTIDSVVDVMLLAIARQMIVEHTSPQENLLAVLSVGVLFVIRKFLYISRLDKRARAGTEKERGQAEGKRAVARRRERGKRLLRSLSRATRCASATSSTSTRSWRSWNGSRPPSSARRRRSSAASSRWRRTLSTEALRKTPCMDGKCHAGGSFIF